MSSTKPKQNDDNSGWIDVKSNNQSPSSKRRRRRKNKNKNNNNSTNTNTNTNTKIKTRSTAPKHAAPPNAATIYCQWYQEVQCNI